MRVVVVKSMNFNGSQRFFSVFLCVYSSGFEDPLGLENDSEQLGSLKPWSKKMSRTGGMPPNSDVICGKKMLPCHLPAKASKTHQIPTCSLRIWRVSLESVGLSHSISFLSLWKAWFHGPVNSPRCHSHGTFRRRAKLLFLMGPFDSHTPSAALNDLEALRTPTVWQLVLNEDGEKRGRDFPIFLMS